MVRDSARKRWTPGDPVVFQRTEPGGDVMGRRADTDNLQAEGKGNVNTLQMSLDSWTGRQWRPGMAVNIENRTAKLSIVAANTVKQGKRNEPSVSGSSASSQ